jgi:hypothetical protein
MTSCLAGHPAAIQTLAPQQAPATAAPLVAPTGTADQHLVADAHHGPLQQVKQRRCAWYMCLCFTNTCSTLTALLSCDAQAADARTVLRQ